MKTKDELIAGYASDLMDLIDPDDIAYKEKGDVIRTTIELAWAIGEAQALRDVIERATQGAENV